MPFKLDRVFSIFMQVFFIVSNELIYFDIPSSYMTYSQNTIIPLTFQYFDPFLSFDLFSFGSDNSSINFLNSLDEVVIDFRALGLFIAEPTIEISVNSRVYSVNSPSINVKLNLTGSKNLTIKINQIAGNWAADLSIFPQFSFILQTNSMLFKSSIVLKTLDIPFQPWIATLSNSEAFSQGCLKFNLSNFLIDIFPEWMFLNFTSPNYLKFAGSFELNAFSNFSVNNSSATVNSSSLQIPTLHKNGSSILIRNIFNANMKGTEIFSIKLCGFTNPFNFNLDNSFSIQLNGNNIVAAFSEFRLTASFPFRFLQNSLSAQVLYLNQPGFINATFQTAFDFSLGAKIGFQLNFSQIVEWVSTFDISFFSPINNSSLQFFNQTLPKSGIFFGDFSIFSENLRTGIILSIRIPEIQKFGQFLVHFGLIHIPSMTSLSENVIISFVVWNKLESSFKFTPLNLNPGQISNVIIEVLIDSQIVLDGSEFVLEILMNPGMSMIASDYPVVLQEIYPFSYGQLQFNQITSTLIISNVTMHQIPGKGSYFNFMISNLLNSVKQIHQLQAELSLSRNSSRLWTAQSSYSLSPIDFNFNSSSFSLDRLNNFSLFINFSTPFYLNFEHFFTITFPKSYLLSLSGDFFAKSNLLTSFLKTNTSSHFVDVDGCLNLVFRNLFANAIPSLVNYIWLKGLFDATIIPYVDSVSLNIYFAETEIFPVQNYRNSILSQNQSIAFLIPGCPNACLQCNVTSFLCNQCWNKNFYLSRNGTACSTTPELVVSSNSTLATDGFDITSSSIIRSVYVGFTYSTISFIVGTSIVLKILYSTNLNILPFAAMSFCVSHGILNWILIIHNFCQWKTKGFLFNFPIFVSLILNLTLIFWIDYKKQRSILKTTKFMNIQTNSLLFKVLNSFFGVGLSFWVLCVRKKKQFLCKNGSKDEIIRDDEKFFGLIFLLNLFLMVCNDICIAVTYFIYLFDAKKLIVLIFVNITVSMSVHILFIYNVLDDLRKKMEEKLHEQKKKNNCHSDFDRTDVFNFKNFEDYHPIPDRSFDKEDSIKHEILFKFNEN